MTVFQIIALLLSFAAAGSYINLRFLKLPPTIGLMVFALLLSMFALGLHYVGLLDVSASSAFINQIDFTSLLLHGMLSFLLFAGAMHINLQDLKKHQLIIATLATFGVVIATFVTSDIIYWAAQGLGLYLPYIYALLFGALISPTDPVAILGILKDTGMSKALRVKIGSESLLNDGAGVVLFLMVLEIATHPDQHVEAKLAALFLAWQGIGSILLGLSLGWLVLRLMSTIDDYKVEVFLTLALVSGGYSLAELSHVSAPITMVIAGLMIGDHRRGAVAERSRKNLDLFWELLDEILNAVLFMLIGLEMMVITFRTIYLAMGLAAIIAVLVGRFVSVAAPVSLMRLRYRFERGTIRLLTWGGLRGGISVAMALSLPPGPEKELLLGMTYIVVVFSVLFQGTTFRYVAQAILRKKSASANVKVE